MNPMIDIQNLCFTYGSRSVPTLTDINLQVQPGEFVLITGQTGCGKSTLLKTLNGLIPHESGGRFSGRVLIDGQDTRTIPVTALSETVGLVFQNPDDQIFSTQVKDEVAFVLENMGLDPQTVSQQVSEALAAVGLAGKEPDSVFTLSGGQKQRLAIASVIAARPGLLALDEPISQVDPQGAQELLAVLKRLNTELGITILIVEHRLHEVVALCDRVVVMEAGRIVWDGPKEAVFSQPDILLRHGLRLPQPIAVCHQLAVEPQLEVAAAVAAIKSQFAELSSAQPPAAGSEPACPADELVRLRDVWFRYPKQPADTLKAVSLSLRGGEIVALMGTNGAGKTTLLQQINGLLQPDAGEVAILGNPAAVNSGQVGQVLQNPDLMLFKSTVRAEILFGCRQAADLAPALDSLGLNGLEEEFPLALSRGQRMRVAIAAVLACRPQVLLLDEPTTGQDAGRIEDIAGVLHEFAAGGGAVLFCTHDTEMAAKIASRIVVMSEGRIVADGHPSDVFSQETILAEASLRLPPVVAMGRALIGKTTLTVEEVVSYVRQACMGSDSPGFDYPSA